MPLASASSDTPATSASASPSRPRQIRRVSRFGPAISREVGTRTGTRPELSRCSECAREERRRRTQRNGARFREGPFASVALARVRLCRLRCSFAALFGRKQRDALGLRGREARARSSSNLGIFSSGARTVGGGHEEIAGFRPVAQRRSFTTRVEARVVRGRCDGFRRWAEQRGRPSKRRWRPPEGPRRHGCAKAEGFQGKGGTKSRARRWDRRARRRARRPGRTRRWARPRRPRWSRRWRGGG